MNRRLKARKNISKSKSKKQVRVRSMFESISCKEEEGPSAIKGRPLDETTEVEGPNVSKKKRWEYA